MASNETAIKIRNRSFSVAIDGLTEIEIASIAGQVEKKMLELEESTKTADTSKLAVLAALDFAAELYNLKQRSESLRAADSRKVDELIEKLEISLGGDKSAL